MNTYNLNKNYLFINLFIRIVNNNNDNKQIK